MSVGDSPLQVAGTIAVRRGTLEELRRYTDAGEFPDYSSAISRLLLEERRSHAAPAGIIRHAGHWKWQAVCACGWSSFYHGRRKGAERVLLEHQRACSGARP